MGVDYLIKSDQNILHKGKNVNVNNMTIQKSQKSKMGEERQRKPKENYYPLLRMWKNQEIPLKLD